VLLLSPNAVIAHILIYRRARYVHCKLMNFMNFTGVIESYNFCIVDIMWVLKDF